MTFDTEALHPISNTDKKDLVADIVFVHGLAGGAHSTWRYSKKGKDDHFFWPEALGKDLQNCAIWSLGYDAGIGHWFGKPGMSIEERAKNLVLKLLNSNLGQRPLIFITHSMGGLEVKEIVVRSQTCGSDEWKDLVSSIRGIVFCGTPHRGAHLATAAKVLSNYLRTQKHLQQMEMGAPGLDTLHNEFITWQRSTGVKIESYIEKIGLFRTKWWRRSVPLGLVVTNETGNPGIANCDCYPIAADHITLVKPKSPESDIYGGVLRFTKKIIATETKLKEATNKHASNTNENSVLDNQASIVLPVQNILFDIYSPECEQYYIKRNIDEGLKIALQPYSIWVSGPSGCGKTSAVRHLIHKNNSHPLEVCLAPYQDNLNTESIIEEIIITACQRYGFERNYSQPSFSQLTDILSKHAIESPILLYIDEVPIRNNTAKGLADLVSLVANLLDTVKQITSKANIRFVISSIQKPDINGSIYTSKLSEQMIIKEMPLWSDEELFLMLDTLIELLKIENIVSEEKIKIIENASGLPRFIKTYLRNKIAYPEIDQHELLRKTTDQIVI